MSLPDGRRSSSTDAGIIAPKRSWLFSLAGGQLNWAAHQLTWGP